MAQKIPEGVTADMINYLASHHKRNILTTPRNPNMSTEEYKRQQDEALAEVDKNTEKALKKLQEQQ